MKPSATTLDGIADITRVETTGQIRRVGSQMLLALARKEISATDVEVAAKMISAVSLSMHTEVKLAMAAILLREKGADIARVSALGQTLIGDHQFQSITADQAAH